MSDFLTELRGELLDAHAARRRRSRVRRLTRALAYDAPRALAAATLVAVVVVAVLVTRSMISPPSGAPRVIDVIRVGGNPTDAVFADGSVWVSDFAGRRVIELTPANRRVAKRFAVGGQPVALAAGRSGVWVRTAVGDGGAVRRIGSRAATSVGYGSTLAATATATWAADVELGPERLRRIDARMGRHDGLVDLRGVYALASGGASLWAVAANATVLRLDPRTGAVRARWPALALSSGTAAPALAADDHGAWVLRVGQGADSQAIRLEGDRIVRRVPIPPSTRPLLALAPDGLWTVTEDAVRHRFAAVRFDPDDGDATARVDLGTRNPTALLPVDHELWITSSDGTITVVGDR